MRETVGNEEVSGKCSGRRGDLRLTGVMRLPRSPVLPTLLVANVLGTMIGAGWSTTVFGSGALWTSGAIAAVILFAALLPDSE